MAKILIIDDDPYVVEFISDILALSGYEVSSVTDPRKGISAFSHIRPDICVLDFTMPGMTGREVCRELKAIDRTVEVLFLTGHADTELAVEMMKLGATDYLIKPLKVSELQTALLRALEHRRLVHENVAYRERLEALVAEKTNALNEALAELSSVHMCTVEALGRALDFRDQSTSGHSRRVAQLTAGIAQRLGIGGSELVQIEQGALLHDVGKLRIPDNILLKKTALTPMEWATMKRHPEYGREFLEKLDFLNGAADLVYSHHEKFDGSGYPRGLHGDEIPIGARCFAIVDSVDALIYERPYHAAISFDQAASEIRKCAGSQFDPSLVDLALSHIEQRL